MTPADMSRDGPLLKRATHIGTVLGVVSIILGVLVLAWPMRTLVIIAVLFGIELVILGVFRIAIALALVMPGKLRALGAVLGILTVAAGVFCFFRPGTSLTVVALFLAIGFIADGVAELARITAGKRAAGVRRLTALSGAVSILAGLLVIIFPETSLILLAQVGGVALIVIGLVQITVGIVSRRQASTAAVKPH